jgi:hypothetical protein
MTGSDPKKVELFPRFALRRYGELPKNGEKLTRNQFNRSFVPLTDVNGEYFIFFARAVLAHGHSSAQKPWQARKRIASAD